jgi:hypothetical protein
MLLSKLNFQPPNILKLTDASDDYPKMVIFQPETKIFFYTN